MNTNKLDYSYHEPIESLNIRIDFHKKYSSFSLEKYISKTYKFSDKVILDIGSGNGNLTGILSNSASLYIGLEKNLKSLLDAHEKFRNKNHIFFFNQNMDKSMFFPDNSFDYIFFIYSVYYTNDAKKLFSKCFRFLKKGGNIVLIGPAENNAWEIDDFCFQLFGKKTLAQERAKRIENEFSPLLESFGMEVNCNKINFDLQFPDYNTFLRYISATLQYRDSYIEGLDKRLARSLIEKKYGKTLTKQSVVLCAEKK